MIASETVQAVVQLELVAAGDLGPRHRHVICSLVIVVPTYLLTCGDTNISPGPMGPNVSPNQNRRCNKIFAPGITHTQVVGSSDRLLL